MQKKSACIPLLLLLLSFTACGNEQPSGLLDASEPAAAGITSAAPAESRHESMSDSTAGYSEIVSEQGTTSAPEAADYGISNLPLGMYLSIKEIRDGVVTLEIDNQSGYEMTYNGDFILEVQENGQWETVSMLDGAVIVDVLYTIPDLQKDTLTIDLYSLYGTLSPGHYRLMQEDMSAEFDLE